jgi:hypothetical protein
MPDSNSLIGLRVMKSEPIHNYPGSGSAIVCCALSQLCTIHSSCALVAIHTLHGAVNAWKRGRM